MTHPRLQADAEVSPTVAEVGAQADRSLFASLSWMMCERTPDQCAFAPSRLRQLVQVPERAVTQLQDQIGEAARHVRVHGSPAPERIEDLIFRARSTTKAASMLVKSLEPGPERLAYLPATDLAVEPIQLTKHKGSRDDLRHHECRFPDMRVSHTKDEAAVDQHPGCCNAAPVRREVNPEPAHRRHGGSWGRLALRGEPRRLHAQRCVASCRSLAEHCLGHG